MFDRAYGVARFLSRCAVMVVASISVANAQSQPNPPTGLSVDGGAPVPGTPPPAGLLLFDDFNYVVNKLDSRETKIARFTAAGWTAVKDEQVRPGAASGYLSTVTSIPGYTGQMPGLSGSGRVLRLEGLPTSMGDFSGPSGSWRNQTDFYLAYGTPGGSQPSVPANVWYQFWIYINDFGTERSHWSNRNKFIYPSDDGIATADGTEHAYLVSLRPTSQFGAIQDSGPRAYVVSRITAGNTGVVQSTSPDGDDYVGANLDPANDYSSPNRWYLYKIHVDHASEQGRYEVWRRPMGGSWEKTSEWISGVTPGFTWITQQHLRVGHNMFKVPTTWGTASTNDNSNYDTWVYMADFAVGTREADLPTYSSY